MARNLGNCPDCDVEVGEPHEAGCDVARCKCCGKQDISCARCPITRPSTIWKGVWPGEIEVEEYGLEDLNQLALLSIGGEMIWDMELERFIAVVSA